VTNEDRARKILLEVGMDYPSSDVAPLVEAALGEHWAGV
jgi:hypothetical protein